MRPFLLMIPLVAVVLLDASPEPAPTMTEWGDKNLPVSNSLEIWVDASTLNAARRSEKRGELAPGQPVDTWYDGSRRGRHLRQQDAKAQPTYVVIDGKPALRFDGKQQHLALAGLNASLKETTIFVVAAPFSNRGDFRAFLAMNRQGQNDYASGMTFDQGPGGSPRFQVVNPEGAGFGGAVNLLKEPSDFGVMQRLCLTSAVGKDGTKLYVNGRLQGQRDRADSVLSMDQLTVGARFYTNGGAPAVRGFLEGDIAEVIVYNRVLTDDERKSVDSYLSTKHGDQRKVPLPVHPNAGKPLVSVPNPPPVQVLVPGFTVRQLPIDLPNINNVLYRPDGKLVALGYDGNVYLLSDTNGDGLEDKVEVFWDNKGRVRAPIGMALTPPGYKAGQGVFVASKGKCSLLLDSKGTGKADQEIVIADGWQEIGHGVDALGVAVDPKDGSVFFGLGTASYANGYLLDKDGKSAFNIKSERGTIMRVAPDFKSREVVCTGIRFPVGMRFNSKGDLFCTDQEGATWLPNGNPLDELLHIEKGRHYGFPPRHPKHLPNVIDEPSVFDYAPQHQSTCGLNFNEPVNGGPVFGPASWQGDVFVTGYSRGKLYRTQLVKTSTGYVAHNQLFAELDMLAVDACVSPTGDLVVAVHSGGPDWGSGPSGKGKLYKISYTGRDLPQPVLAWAQSPREVRIAFDRPLQTEHLQALAGKISIEYGRYVAAGDRFEKLRPGYQVVQDQLMTPRFDLPVLSTQLLADRRTVMLVTAPHPEVANYAVTLPGLGRTLKIDGSKGELRQIPETDLQYDLSGVEATWKAGDKTWSVWLPHVDLAVARKLTVGSAAHDEFWAAVQKGGGQLRLNTRLNLKDMLHPAVQPGAKLDHEYPAEKVTITFHSRGKILVAVNVPPQPSVTSEDQARKVSFTVSPKPDALVGITVLVDFDGVPDLSVSYHTNEDDRPRALQTHRFLLPWAELTKNTTPIVRDIPELKGGNWARGRKLFFGEPANCSKCHTMRGEGGTIGPNLSNLPQRDYQSVLRDITEPSFAINPDYISHVIALKDGRVLTGTVRTEGEKLHIGDTTGKLTTVRRDQIEEMKISPLSIMPEGLHKQLGPEKMKDLLTFLLTDPPAMPDYGKDAPPAPRTMAEVKAVLAGAPEPPAKVRPIHVVLVAGKKDHGPGEHDYPAWKKTWEKLLGMADNLTVTTAEDWPSVEDLKKADVLVFYQQGKWTPERAKDMDAFLSRGGGLVYIHYAVDGGADAPGFAQRIGLAWQGGKSKFRHGPLDLGFETGIKHPISRNFDKVHFHDESYWNLIGDPKTITLLASGDEEGKPQPLFWTLEPSKGRVFVSIPGHFSWTFDDPLFRVLVLRGIAWTAKEPVDRFNALVTPGARIKE